jgi:hypothetical protein
LIRDYHGSKEEEKILEMKRLYRKYLPNTVGSVWTSLITKKEIITLSDVPLGMNELMNE